MQDEITYLRTEISANKDKATNVSTNLSATANGTSLSINSSDGTNISVPAATTSAWGIMTDDHATAIDANTAKVSFAGGSATTLSFGELITTSGGKGQPSTYTIVLTATKSGVTKTVTLTLT